MVKIYILFILSLLVRISFSANELYVSGAASVITTAGVYNSSCVIFVTGEIKNDNSLFVNDNGTIELTGNWTNTITNNKYQSSGIERFSGASNQVIDGVWNGTIGNNNQFYDLEIKKTSSSGQYISLNTNVNINTSGSISFTNTNGIIRTDGSSHGNDGSAYANILFLQNPTPSAFSGYSALGVSNWNNNGGANTKYIEGKLKRNVSSNNTYDFPFGVAIASLDGMEGVKVKFNSTFTTTGLLGYIQPVPFSRIAYTSDLIPNGESLFYDIGGDPSTPPTNQFQNCIGGPDGYDDIAIIDAAVNYEWIMTPDAATSNYDISVHPGSVMDNLTYVAMGSPCNSTYPITKYLARDGVIGGDQAIGPVTHTGPPSIMGLMQPPTGNKLVGQTGWSRFRIFGTTDPSNTSLPIELTSFTILPVENTYFQLNWITASEFNNSGYEIQRSLNNTDFIDIGFVGGNGTTNSPHNYVFQDDNVIPEIDYYYRLKQIDFDGKFSYSSVLNGRLRGGSIYTISDFYPNPTNGLAQLDIYAPKETQLKMTIYDLLGQTIRIEQKSIQQGYNKMNFDVSYLPNASYITKFSLNNQTITKQFIKQ